VRGGRAAGLVDAPRACPGFRARGLVEACRQFRGDGDDSEGIAALSDEILGQELDVPMETVAATWGLWLSRADPCVRELALDFVVAAVEGSAGLGARLLDSGAIVATTLIAEFSRPAAYSTRLGSLLGAMIDSSRVCCDHLMIIGLVDAATRCLACETAQMPRVWWIVCKIARRMSPEVLTVPAVLELCGPRPAPKMAASHRFWSARQRWRASDAELSTETS